MRIVPFLMVCYFVSFLDRVNLGFAALEMVKDPHLSSTVFGVGGGIFFVSYFPEAATEIRDALSASPKQAEFRTAIDDELRDIASGLKTHARIARPSIRQCIMIGFPYSIIYERFTTITHVLAVAADRRRPGYWSARK